MKDYFYDSIPEDEKARLRYIPTVSEFLEWIEKEYAELPAVSNLEVTYNYKENTIVLPAAKMFLPKASRNFSTKMAASVTDSFTKAKSTMCPALPSIFCPKVISSLKRVGMKLKVLCINSFQTSTRPCQQLIKLPKSASAKKISNAPAA